MKRCLAILLTVLMVLMSFTACSYIKGLLPGGDPTPDDQGSTPLESLKINVPSDPIEAELGSFDLPKYQVINEENLIKAGYEVIVKKVLDPNGNEVTVAYNKINATVTGVYTITYGVVEGDVADAELKVSFADRTAPTIDIKDDAIPKYYIQSMSYALPVYQLAGEPDYSKCYVKVYYFAENGAEAQEVTVTDGRFTVDYNTGFYQIVIHAEDAVGNAKDYTYKVEATGPSAITEGKIIYSDEAFGTAQLEFLWNVWTKEYSTEMAWGDEAGSIKVTSTGATDYLILSKLIQKDVSEYDYLVYRVYNDSDHPITTGAAWFGDTVLEPKQWTEVKLSLEDLNNKGSHPQVAGLKPKSTNLENLSIRFWDDAEKNTLTAGSVLYVSAMYAEKQTITGPSEVKEDVIAYYDEIWGSMQGEFFWSDCNKQEFVTDIKYGDEAGSLKVTCLKDGQGWNYYILKNPAITNITKYDYIEFYVYNASGADALIQLLWGGDTNCKAGEWTKVRFPVSLIANGITDVNNKPIPATDISGLTMCIWTGSQVHGDAFYFSAIKGGYNPEVLPDNLITNFDGATGLNPFNGTSSVEFVTDVKYEGEKGSLKITANGGGEHYVSILNPLLANVSGYDYIVFRVYTEKDITAGLLWCADTVCKAGQWTEIRVPVSYFAEGKVTDFAAALSATNIKGISLRIFSGLEAGESVYVSSMFAMKEEAPEHTHNFVDGKCECGESDPNYVPPQPNPEIEGDLIIGVDELGVNVMWADPHFVTLTTDVKYGNETASMKVEMTKANGWNYLRLVTPLITDVSSYDAIEFYVYNATSADFVFGLLWCGDTNCKAGEWTKVSFPVSLLANVTDMNGAKIEATNIQGLDFIFYSGGTVVGESFYISSIKAVGGKAPEHTHNFVDGKCECGESDPNYVPPQPKPEFYEDIISKLDGELNPFNGTSTTEYVTDVKFENEEGSLKITANAAGEMYIAIVDPELRNAGSYDYLVFRVYNPNSYDITVGTMWWADTVCKAGEWTEVKIDKSAFAEGKVDALSGADVLMTDLAGFSIRIVGTMTVGDSIYVSYVRAGKADETVVSGAVADLGTLSSPEGKEGSYLNRYSADGWFVVNGRSDEELNFGHPYDMLTINGKLSAIGRVTSPYYNGKLTQLYFNYGYAYTENGNISLTVNIKVDGKVVATKQINDTGVTKYEHMTFNWVLETPVEGRFMIEIINNCPTQSTSNKDRIGIWNIKWGDAIDVAPDVTVSKLDSAAGLNPFNGCAEVEYVTDVKFGEEEGALKITANAAGEMYIAITTPELKNVSSYDYIVFRVYNPNDYDITVGTMWWADTVCKAGKWTLVKIEKSAFKEGKVDALSGADVTLVDITGFSVRIVGTMVVGDSIYVSNVCATMTPVEPHYHEFVEGKCECGESDPDYKPVSNVYEDVVSKLDGALNPFNGCAATEYVTDVKYGDETGSLKITSKTGGDLYISILNPILKNVASYEYLAFRVYNPTDSVIKAGVLWWADTDCAPGEWTEIRVPVADIVAGKITDFGASLPVTNITGFSLRIISGLDTGSSVYVSHVVAVKAKGEEVRGGTADLGTLTNPEGSSEGSYLERTSDAGWHLVWARSDEEPTFGHSYDMITINGRTDRVGIVTSPYLRGGIGKLSFGYGYAYTENGYISLTINIRVGGEIAATTQLDEMGLEKCANYEFVWELAEPIEGDFMIEIINNCPTGSSSNKDRVGIWNICWE